MLPWAAEKRERGVRLQTRKKKRRKMEKGKEMGKSVFIGTLIVGLLLKKLWKLF